MGMNMWNHYMSWFSFYMTLHSILTLIWAIIAMRCFKEADFGIIFFIYFLLGFFMICLAIFIQSFFTAAKPGVLAGVIAFFLLYGASIGL